MGRGGGMKAPAGDEGEGSMSMINVVRAFGVGGTGGHTGGMLQQEAASVMKATVQTHAMQQRFK